MDKSDEIFTTCCAEKGKYPAYTEKVCKAWFQCKDLSKYIPIANYCDGQKKYANADKAPDCPDGSDEVFKDCCNAGVGKYPKYTT